MRPARVLIVDDDPLLARAIGRVLTRHGIETVNAKNGIDALRLLADEVFDLVISDVRMPVMDGATMLTRMKRDGKKHPAVVFLTAHGDHSADELLALGARAVYTKPIDAGEVVNLVHAWRDPDRAGVRPS